jgi:hypothetical protein
VSDRPIHLDLGMPASTPFDVHAGKGEQPPTDTRGQQQLDDDAQSLRALLDAGRHAPPAAPAPTAQRPFDLFGGPAALQAAPPAASAPSAAQDLPGGIDDTLASMAKRLLVSDGSSGRRAVQIQLADDSLPGVVLDVFEEEGLLVTCFTCSHEGARERLARNAQWLADGLAGRLTRPVCVRVLADDPEDPCPVEARAGA